MLDNKLLILIKGGSKMKFINNSHKAFYEENIRKTNSQNDPYRKALFFTLGLTDETRKRINELYDFNEHGIDIEGLDKPWHTNTTMKVCRLAFNLYNGFNGQLDSNTSVDDPAMYTPENLFCCDLAPYFYEAVKIRYPEYVRDNSLHLNRGNDFVSDEQEDDECWCR